MLLRQLQLIDRLKTGYHGGRQGDTSSTTACYRIVSGPSLIIDEHMIMLHR